MEFGIFIQNDVPESRREADPDAEHTVNPIRAGIDT